MKMNRLETPNFIHHPGFISAGLIQQVKRAKTETQLLEIINKNNNKVHGILLNLDATRLTQSFILRLIEQNLLDIDEEFPTVYSCIPPTFRQYTKMFDDSLLLNIETNVNKYIDTIKKINNPEDMYLYILNNPGDVHTCMVWASWESFTFELIFRLVRDGLLNINIVNKSYCTETEKNMSFKSHCVALLKEMDKNDCNYKKLRDIVYFLVHYV